jgi:hypothetical protein
MRAASEATWVAVLLAMSQAGCSDEASEQLDRDSDEALTVGGAAGAGPSDSAGAADGDPGGSAGAGGGGGVPAAGAGEHLVGGAAGASGAVSAAGARGIFAGPPGADDTTAIALDDRGIVAWATGVTDLVFGAESTNEAYHDEANALGPATGVATDVLVLGDSGQVTLTFGVTINNGDGFDFAVFENGVSETFLELAYVEVSSDGETFARFASTYLGTQPVASFGAHDPRDIDGLAGKYPVGYGTPFDLSSLVDHPDVEANVVDLDRVSHVRIVDVMGDGSAQDSHGNPIYDPHPTVDTAGFDLEAVAVLNAAP